MGTFISRVLAIIVAAIILCWLAAGGCVLLIGGCTAVLSHEREQHNRTNQEVTPSEPPATSPTTTSDAAPSQALAPATATSNPEPPTTSSPSGFDGHEWADAGNAVRQGDVEIRVIGAAVDFVPLKTIGGKSQSAERLLIVRLELKNVGVSKKIEYRGWGARWLDVGGASRGSLRDGQRNSYARCHFEIGDKPVGQVQDESIYPGTSISDVLVFERPIDGTEALYLELPAETFGGTGQLRFKISASTVAGTTAAAAAAQKLASEDAQNRRIQAIEDAERETQRLRAVEDAKYRTWTSADGKYTVMAKLLSASSGVVKLQKRDGSTVSLPKEKLSANDLNWLADKASRQGK